MVDIGVPLVLDHAHVGDAPDPGAASTRDIASHHMEAGTEETTSQARPGNFFLANSKGSLESLRVRVHYGL